MNAPVFNVPRATTTQIIISILVLFVIIFFFFGGLYYYKKLFQVLSEEKVLLVKRYASNNKLSKYETDLLIDIIKREKIQSPEIFLRNSDQLKSVILKYISLYSSKIMEPKKLIEVKNALYNILNKLCNFYRPKRRIYNSEKLKEGQKIRIEYNNRFFYSQVLKVTNSYILIERVQIFDDPNAPMANLPIKVYFYNKGDAGYSFETKITRDINNPKVQALMLAHSNKLRRHQKRKFLRKNCNIPSQITMLEINVVNGKKKIKQTNIRLQGLILDLSIAGALIKIMNLNNYESIQIGKYFLLEFVINQVKIRIIANIINITNEENIHSKFVKILDNNAYVINDFIFM